MKKLPKEQIEGTANAIMEHFIPKDAQAGSFTFNFTIPPKNNFMAKYDKNTLNQWELVSVQECSED